MRGMGGMGGMGGLMTQAQKMQQKLAKVQEELKQTEFTGEAANGAVKVVITGGHECRSIKIDPKVVDPEDIEMLEDLVMLAFNNAQQTCRTESEAAMNKAVPKAARDFSSHAERSARVRRMAPFGRRAASGGAFLYAAHFGGA